MIDLAATMALVQLSTQPPAADAATLHHKAQQLLDAGADPNHHEALYHACEHTNHGVLEAILGSPKLEPPWLSYCLLRMLDFDDLEGVEKMLRAGADPNLRSRQGDREMTLHHSIRRGRDSAAIQLLLAHGARPDIINIHNHTARRQAIRFGLADFGETAPEATPLDYWLHQLWQHPAQAPPPETLGKQDIRLLIEAARLGRHDVVRNMIAAGFPVDPEAGDELEAMGYANTFRTTSPRTPVIR